MKDGYGEKIFVYREKDRSVMRDLLTVRFMQTSFCRPIYPSKSDICYDTFKDSLSTLHLKSLLVISSLHARALDSIACLPLSLIIGQRGVHRRLVFSHHLLASLTKSTIPSGQREVSRNKRLVKRVCHVGMCCCRCELGVRDFHAGKPRD